MGYEDWNDNLQAAKQGDHDWDSVAGYFDSIPIIDVGGIRSDDLEQRKAVAAKIRDACTRVGFFYIENHGIPRDLIDNVFEQAEKFFNLPFEKKMEIFIDNSTNFRGFTPVGGSGKPGPDGKGNMNESFQWGHDAKLNDDPNDACQDPYMAGLNLWPKEPTGFEETLSLYYRELRAFCRLMARNIALSLDVPEDYFDPYTSHPGCCAVVAHYPPQDRKSLTRGLDAHTDSEFFTVLAPGPVRALEVANKNNQWISAPPRRGAFVFNVGDQLQAFTNELYISTRHRVMNYSGEERYSVPFFFLPNYETVIKPIPQLVTNPRMSTKYPSISAGQMYRENMALLHRIASTSDEYAQYRKNGKPVLAA